MLKRYKFCLILLIIFIMTSLSGCVSLTPTLPSSTLNGEPTTTIKPEIIKTDAEWQELLTSEQYRVTRKGGTEPAFSGEYNNFYQEGVYICVCCGNELFSSETKFNSGTGWPSYYAPFSEKSVITSSDTSLGMTRTEVRCRRCDAHLGHVFSDGPQPTGLRYCINSVALEFMPNSSR